MKSLAWSCSHTTIIYQTQIESQFYHFTRKRTFSGKFIISYMTKELASSSIWSNMLKYFIIPSRIGGIKKSLTNIGRNVPYDILGFGGAGKISLSRIFDRLFSSANRNWSSVVIARNLCWQRSSNSLNSFDPTCYINSSWNLLMFGSSNFKKSARVNTLLSV